MPDARSPLTPPVGYTVMLAQLVGQRPRLSIDCTRCHWHAESRAWPLDLSDAASIGEPVRAALTLWLEHASEHIPQAVPAVGGGAS